ncbi:hypothetical protein BVRB_8g200700 [Beta vulgaris subsp. vulgaris]|uniref:Uncharacterized protein n=1 Tax=Beta vulgaris subsp. vulgaris TaxID=3555 RepID=A0A0J8B9K8_BETVV|nr:hypothetical protein BVRB_8g200700 [Beta vulgaris subsp. vulgaris]
MVLFHSLAEGGLHASLMYFLKVEFHFSKNQFANLMLIVGIVGMVSQLVLMTMLLSVTGEELLLRIGLLVDSGFFHIANGLLVVALSVFKHGDITFVVVTLDGQNGPNLTLEGTSYGCDWRICFLFGYDAFSVEGELCAAAAAAAPGDCEDNELAWSSACTSLVLFPR